MKRNCIILLGCLIAASCTINRYYIVNEDSVSEARDKKELSSRLKRTSPAGSKTIEYDKALPVVPKLSVIKDASEYNKEDKNTFPIFGNETAVAPPTGQSRLARTAIWCTKECTVVAYLMQLAWDLHYFQESSDSYIEDAATGERYYIKGTYDRTPLDMSYNIKGISGEWISFFNVYPPLPKECTTINIMEGDITDVVKNGQGWGGSLRIRNVPVSRLQGNQGIVKFQKTKIIE